MCTRPDTSYSRLFSSTRAVDDPDSDSFYGSGLLAMPVLCTLLSGFTFTLFYAIYGSYMGLATILVPKEGVNPSSVAPYWVYLSVICGFLSLAISILFYFLVSTTGSQARTRHPRRRSVLKIVVTVASLGVFFLCLFAAISGLAPYLVLSAAVGMYVLCCLFLAR